MHHGLITREHSLCLFLLLLIVIALWPFKPVQSATTSDSIINLDEETGRIPLSSYLELLPNPEGQLDIETILAYPHPWQPLDADEISFGIGDHDWWFRFNARNISQEDRIFLLEIAYSSLDHIGIYVVRHDQVIQRHITGDHYPFQQRPLIHHFFITPLQWKAHAEHEIYLHIKTHGAMQVPATLWEPSAFSRHDQDRQLVAGIYFGTMMVMLLYNLFVYMGIRDPSYLAYAGFVLSLPLFVSSLLGYSYQYLWPEAIIWNEQSIGFFLSTTLFFAGLFTYIFLRLDRQNLPRLIRHGIKIQFIIPIVMMITVFLLPYQRMLLTVIAGAVISCVGALAIGIRGWLRNEEAARYYVLAWTALLLGGIVLAGNKFSIFPQNAFTENAVQLGSVLLVVLLSFAMSGRINSERQGRFEAQLEALKHERKARIAREEALNAQRDANLQLEKLVTERTEALKQANDELQKLSTTDALTGLANRRYLDRQLTAEYSRACRYAHSLSLILIDIDHFKHFNDTWGHQLGDDCLRSTAKIISDSLSRKSDVVTRYGGEEFCVLLPETPGKDALVVAERIRRNIEVCDYLVNGKKVPITISLGVASIVPEKIDEMERLVKKADEALYQSKANGRNQSTLAASWHDPQH